jgi:hypothetical protein
MNTEPSSRAASPVEQPTRRQELIDSIESKMNAVLDPKMQNIESIKILVSIMSDNFSDLLTLRVASVSPVEPVAIFGWLFEGPEGLRRFSKATDFTKPVLDIHRRMAEDGSGRYKLTTLYAPQGSLEMRSWRQDSCATTPSAAPGAALAAPPQAAPHAAPLLPTQAALNSPRINMPPSLSPEEKGAFMLGVAAGNVAALHAVLVEARDALKSLHDGIAEYARMNLLSGFDNHDMKRARAAIASIERTLSQTQEPT